MEKQTGFRGKGKEQKTGVTGIWHRILMGVCCCLAAWECLLVPDSSGGAIVRG